MCGLCGVYSTSFGTSEEDFFEKLLHLNVFRGEDSTGIIRVEKNRSVKTRKSLLPSPLFLRESVSDIITDKTPAPMALLGHTRHATKGAVNLKNAHPFNFSDVTGMHNGTIHTMFPGRKEFDTDSEALYKLINDVGIEEALNEVEAWDSAYALQWVDKKERTLNFVKNTLRPLSFTYVYAGTTLIWSSEKRALQYVLDMKKYSTNTGWRGSTEIPFFTLNEHDLLTIPLGGNPRDEAKITKLNIKKKATAMSTLGGTTRSAKTAAESFSHGEWVETDRGWRFIRKEGSANLPALTDSDSTRSHSSSGSHRKNSEQSQRQTSTSSDDTSALSKSSPDTSTISSEGYKGFRDLYSENELKSLSWLAPFDSSEDEPDPLKTDILAGLFDQEPRHAREEEKDTEVVEADIIPFPEEGRRIKGYGGILVGEAEFAQRMSEGCFCCGIRYNLSDPHDLAGINNVKWWSREAWACLQCYETSDGDWVRHSIDGTWENYSKKEG